jgi:hypothetical protein
MAEIFSLADDRFRIYEGGCKKNWWAPGSQCLASNRLKEALHLIGWKIFRVQPRADFCLNGSADQNHG